jgi:hypothetical protein
MRQVELALVAIRCHRPPLDQRIDEARLQLRGDAIEPSPRFVIVGPATGEGIRGVEDLEAEHVTAFRCDGRVDL